jgi:hypothetical protein
MTHLDDPNNNQTTILLGVVIEDTENYVYGRILTSVIPKLNLSFGEVTSVSNEMSLSKTVQLKSATRGRLNCLVFEEPKSRLSK